MELKVIRHQNNEMTTTSYYLKKRTGNPYRQSLYRQ